MNKIIFATGNAGKMKEIREILQDMNMEILSMKEAGMVNEAAIVQSEANSYMIKASIPDLKQQKSQNIQTKSS